MVSEEATAEFEARFEIVSHHICASPPQARSSRQRYTSKKSKPRLGRIVHANYRLLPSEETDCHSVSGADKKSEALPTPIGASGCGNPHPRARMGAKSVCQARRLGNHSTIL
jgi:hypothetical protein